MSIWPVEISQYLRLLTQSPCFNIPTLPPVFPLSKAEKTELKVWKSCALEVE